MVVAYQPALGLAGIKCGHFTEKAKLFLWSICDRFMVRVILLLALSRFHDFLRPQTCTSMLSSAFCFHLYWTCFFMRIVCPPKNSTYVYFLHMFLVAVLDGQVNDFKHFPMPHPNTIFKFFSQYYNVILELQAYICIQFQ